MKPQEKVVTASDVQSSLYYLHVDSIEDYRLLEFQGSEEEEQPAEELTVPTNRSSQTSVLRKPLLPPRPSLDVVDHPQPRPNIYPHFQAHNKVHIRRRPVTSANNPANQSLEQAPPLPERKFIGPRPINQCFHSIDVPALQNVPEQQKIDLRRWSEQPAAVSPSLPPRPNSELRNEHQNLKLLAYRQTLQPQMIPANDGSLEEHCWEREKSWEAKRSSELAARDTPLSYLDTGIQGESEEGSLSLIRRYNGQQLNVGKIATNGKQSTHRHTRDSRIGMSVEITTPGYSKFTDTGILANGEENKEGPKETSSLTTSDASSTNRGDNSAFRRYLQPFRNAKRLEPGCRLESTDSMSLQGGSMSTDIWRHSQHSSDSPDSPTLGTSKHIIEPLRGYVLQSPWNSRCEFRTGIAGQFLKCKHSYLSTNPNFLPKMHSTTVSKLRFNLPSSKTLGTPAPKISTPGTPADTKRSLVFSRHSKSHSPSSAKAAEPKEGGPNNCFGANLELEDRLDLSLGQERAGGGFGGKKAKLGKLIVEDQGLQMLDLIVAANMAIWWRVYDKFR